MKRLELPHRMADYLCPVNGLCDVYEWKTGKRIPEELIFYAKAGFQMISQKRADAPKMIFLGQGSIGKREYEFWKEIIGYEIMFGEENVSEQPGRKYVHYWIERYQRYFLALICFTCRINRNFIRNSIYQDT